MFNDKGQSLMELVVVIAVIIIVVSALTFATIASLRNAQFSKNQAQATKLAQEGIERIRALRDRDTANAINYIKGDGSMATKFSDLWAVNLSCPTNCYFYFNYASPPVLIGATVANFENIPPPPDTPQFSRKVIIEDVGNGQSQKKVTVITGWTDISGPHESKLTTILGKI